MQAPPHVLPPANATLVLIAPSGASRHPPRSPGRMRRSSQPEIKLPDQIVVVELVGGFALERDLAMDNDVAAVGDAQRLREVLLRHQDGKLVLLLELPDRVDGAADQQRGEAD